MRYFFVPLIWILLQQRIQGFSLDKHFHLQQNTNGRYFKSHNSSKDVNGLSENFNNRYINKEKVFLPKRDICENEQISATLNYEGSSTECTVPLKYPSYENVECYNAPGKIICQIGRLNFVVNNKEHKMDRDVIERFISMAYQRYGEGDDSFDVAVEEPQTTPSICYEAEAILSSTRTPLWDTKPIIIECNLVSNEKLKMCRPKYDPSEKIYQCKAHKLDYKKRNIINISVNSKGTVSFIKDFTLIEPRIRKKRQIMEDDLSEINRLGERSRNFNCKSNEEHSIEENDMSNLRVSTLIPYIRNYTDSCTLRYQFYDWCPQYKLINSCNTTKRPTTCSTQRPCRAARCTTCSTTCSTPCSNDITTCTVCTLEISTIDSPYASLNQKKRNMDRRKRHKMHWRRRRLQRPLKFGTTNIGHNHYVNGRRSVNNKDNWFLANSKLDENYSGSLEKLMDLTTYMQVTVPSEVTSESMWCALGVPYNSTNYAAAPTNSQIQSVIHKKGSQEQKLLHFLPKEKGNFFKNENQIRHSQIRAERQPLHSQLRALEIQNSFSNVVKRNSESNLMNSPESLNHGETQQFEYFKDDFNKKLKPQNSLRKKIYWKKIPRFKRRQIKRRMNNMYTSHPLIIND